MLTPSQLYRQRCGSCCRRRPSFGDHEEDLIDLSNDCELPIPEARNPTTSALQDLLGLDMGCSLPEAIDSDESPPVAAGYAENTEPIDTEPPPYELGGQPEIPLDGERSSATGSKDRKAGDGNAYKEIAIVAILAVNFTVLLPTAVIFHAAIVPCVFVARMSLTALEVLNSLPQKPSNSRQRHGHKSRRRHS